MTRRTFKNDLPFAAILADLMKIRGLTIQQVADIAGVPKSVAHGWLNKAVPYDLAAIGKLAKGLGVSFRSLLLGESEPNGEPRSLVEIFDENKVFEGICKVSITRLSLREKK